MKKNAVLFALICLWGLSACVVVEQHKGSDEEIARVNVDLAVEYFNQDRLDIALANLKKALKADANSVEANSLIALVYDRLDEKTLAQEHFEIAADNVDSDTLLYGQVHNNFGAFLCGINQHLKADEHFMLAVDNKLYTSPDSAYENAGLCVLSLPDMEKAQVYFQKALAINPNRTRSILEIAKIDFEFKKFGKAQIGLMRFHKINKKIPQSLWLAAQIEKALGNRNEAQKLLTQLKNDFPDSKEAVNIRNNSLAAEQ